MKLLGPFKPIVISLACVAAISSLDVFAEPAPTATHTPKAAPATSRPLPTSADTIPIRDMMDLAEISPDAYRAEKRNGVQLAFHDLSVIRERIYTLVPDNAFNNTALVAAYRLQLIPLLYYQLGLYDVIATGKHGEDSVATFRRETLAKLYFLRDSSTVDRVKELLASADPSVRTDGQLIDLYSRWLAADGNDAESSKLADELESMCRAHPDDVRLTQMTTTFCTHTPAITARMRDLQDNVMTDKNSMARKKLTALRAKRASEGSDFRNALIGKPIDLKSTTLDGKPFTSSQYKGKVILVDFWATWCGPCVAGLPHVKDLYTKYHDKGFEVIGADDDTSIEKVQAFIDKHEMPWVQLFEPRGEGANQKERLGEKYKVDAIPTAFLIDRQGILRGFCTGDFTLDDQIAKLMSE